ncbi:MAG TPA: GlsB/YeaQ/YmgE family stress response membrane protein [Kofleriaceae bacterium]|nr:GlsB/YeaQ/YmgE family stress response membrane protein [Kofleriaceae bacterium]
MAAIARRSTGTYDAPGAGMDLLTWLIVGLIAGVLASLIVGSAGGILIDIVVGIVGAFIGGWLFTAAGWHVPFAGLAGTIFVAFIGSLILLVIVHLVRRRPMV